MNLQIGWMYPNMMNLYGDRGNLMVLQKRCRDRDIDVTIRDCNHGEPCDLSQMDLVFFGGGADQEQGQLLQDLLKRKENIQKALDKGTIFLLICGGYQLFGQYYVDANGNQLKSLGLFDYYTISNDSKERCVGNVIVEAELDHSKMILAGFENHGGQTYGITSPLGTVKYGYGNNTKDKQEGFYNGQVLGTYLHGPLLPRNPELADFLIQKSLYRSYGDIVLAPLNDTMEEAAKKIMIRRAGK